jgi:hypothetical protein
MGKLRLGEVCLTEGMSKRQQVGAVGGRCREEARVRGEEGHSHPAVFSWEEHGTHALESCSLVEPWLLDSSISQLCLLPGPLLPPL